MLGLSFSVFEMGLVHFLLLLKHIMFESLNILKLALVFIYEVTIN